MAEIKRGSEGVPATPPDGEPGAAPGWALREDARARAEAAEGASEGWNLAFPALVVLLIVGGGWLMSLLF